MSSNKRQMVLGIIVWLAPMLLAAWAGAQTFSQILSFQGRLCGTDGKPVPDRPYIVQFTIYDAETQGCALWQETLGVTQVGGTFTTFLGSVTPFPSDLFSNGDRWLGIKVGDDPEIADRFRFTPAPWAVHAANSDTVDGFDASGTPTPNRLLPLDGSGMFPPEVVPPDDDWAISGGDIYRGTGNVGIGTPTPLHPLHLVGDLRADGRAALGNSAGFGPSGGWDWVFDLSHTITDFSTSPNWQLLRSHMSLDPSSDLTGADATYIYGHELITQTPAGNAQDIEYFQGPYMAAWHHGTGHVGVLGGGLISADSWGDVTYQVGGTVVSWGHAAASIAGSNSGLEIRSGHTGSGGSVQTDYSLFVWSPEHASPLADHYGIYLEDQDFGEKDSYAVYSDGGKSHFKDSVGIGTPAPEEKLEVAGTVRADDMTRPYSGTPARAVPIAYGTIDDHGAVLSGTANLSCTRTSVGTYMITIDGEYYDYPDYVTVVTPYTAYAIFATVSRYEGKLVVYTRYLSETWVDSAFHFVTYKTN